MAEAPAAEAPQSPPQPAPILTSIDGLDAAMASARQTANAQQAAAEAATVAEPPSAPEPAPAAPETPAETTPSQPATPPDKAPAPEAEGEEDTEPETPADQQQPGRPSRMGRLRDQLTAAEQAKRDVEARLNERLGVDLKVRQKWGTLLGTPEEKTQLEAVLANQASPDFEVSQARTRLAQMRQAQEELSPLYAAVEADVFAGFTRGLDALRTLDGMDEAAHQSLYKAPSGVEALKLMHGIGKRAAEDEFKGEIASLKAQVSDLKTKVAASAAQPATPGGKASGTLGKLPFPVDERGFPTEEAIAAGKAGAYRNIGRETA